jgi:hypothetical protein
LDTPYTVARIVEIASGQKPGDFNSPDLKLFLLRVAAMKGRESEISHDRLGWWLRRISGRIVDGLRLVQGSDTHTKNYNYRLANA